MVKVNKFIVIEIFHNKFKAGLLTIKIFALSLPMSSYSMLIGKYNYIYWDTFHKYHNVVGVSTKKNSLPTFNYLTLGDRKIEDTGFGYVDF